MHFIVWCLDCRHRVEPDPAEIAKRHGAETTVPDWKSRLVFLEALAEALREEYKAIIEAGFVLQLDDPGLPDTWDMANPEPNVADYQKFAMLRVEALNHALRDLPDDQIRYHICWGSWHGPHTTDLPLKNIADVLLQVRAGAFSIEAGNVRHEHEWKVWRDVTLVAWLTTPGRAADDRVTRVKEAVTGITSCGFSN